MVDTQLRISGILSDSIVDGPGIRMVIFTQGCPHHCVGCQNPETHDFSAGRLITVGEILSMLDSDPLQSGVTFSGGEPFCQPEALLVLAHSIKERGKHLMVYSGYTFEELAKMDNPSIQELLHLCDILVDGPFLIDQKSLDLHFRGSSNQRIIDLPQTFKQGKIILSKYHT